MNDLTFGAKMARGYTAKKETATGQVFAKRKEVWTGNFFDEVLVVASQLLASASQSSQPLILSPILPHILIVVQVKLEQTSSVGLMSTVPNSSAFRGLTFKYEKAGKGAFIMDSRGVVKGPTEHPHNTIDGMAIL